MNRSEGVQQALIKLWLMQTPMGCVTCKRWCFGQHRCCLSCLPRASKEEHKHLIWAFMRPCLRSGLMSQLQIWGKKPKLLGLGNWSFPSSNHQFKQMGLKKLKPLGWEI